MRDVFTVPGGCTLVRGRPLLRDRWLRRGHQPARRRSEPVLAGAPGRGPGASSRPKRALVTSRRSRAACAPVAERQRLRGRHRLRVVLTSLLAVQPGRGPAPDRPAPRGRDRLRARRAAGPRRPATSPAPGRGTSAASASCAWRAAQVKVLRRVKDREVRRLQTPGSARFTGYVRRQMARDDEARGLRARRVPLDAHRQGLCSGRRSCGGRSPSRSSSAAATSSRGVCRRWASWFRLSTDRPA